jgi:hypothetical protein
MNDKPPSLLHRFAYGLLAVAVAGYIVIDFERARRRELVHDRTTLPLVTRERAMGWDGPWEVRARGGIWIMVQGLSPTEILPQARRPWRHGLAPATIVTVAPRTQAARIKYAFDNSDPDQVMTIRVGDREAARRGPLDVGQVTGEVEIPPSTGELRVEFAFSCWKQPLPDTRKITVTFRELTLMLP